MCVAVIASLLALRFTLPHDNFACAALIAVHKVKVPKMATLSQEINTLREEIGYQHAILASLQGSTDPNRRYDQAKCLQEIELLQARLLHILRMHLSLAKANGNANANDFG